MQSMLMEPRRTTVCSNEWVSVGLLSAHITRGTLAYRAIASVDDLEVAVFVDGEYVAESHVACSGCAVYRFPLKAEAALLTVTVDTHTVELRARGLGSVNNYQINTSESPL